MTATAPGVQRYRPGGPHSETAVDPHTPVCDPHHHLMRRDWIRYEITDLLDDLAAGHRVTSTIYVECSSAYRTSGPEALRPVGEVEYVVAQDPVPDGVMSGIVARADLALGDAVHEVIEAHLAAARGRLNGIRFSTAWNERRDNAERIPGMLGDARVRAGITVLGGFGLPLDCWLYAPQLDELCAVARTIPDQVFVLDHLGMPLPGLVAPSARPAVLAEWRRKMSDVASYPNVRLKIGGLAMPVMGAPWTADTPPSSQDIASFWRSDVAACIEAFGPDRCMFESNFPIDGMIVDYVTLWNAFKLLAMPYSADERSALLHDTAVSTYHVTTKY
jgi:L-fuconolactonase